jgi:hypothetical protein
VAVLVLGCTDDGSKTTAPQLSGAVVGGASADRGGNGNGQGTGNNQGDNGNHNGQRLDIVMLTGSEEVPPRDTPAHGQLILQLSDDGQSMKYILDVEDIKNVTQAHIHIAPKGVNGPIAIWLYPSPKTRTALPGGGGPVERLLVQGTFTKDDFIQGATAPLNGKTMADFVAIVNAAGAYGNVHTSDGVDPPNTGPGDFPGGEIRGQLDGHGKH